MNYQLSSDNDHDDHGEISKINQLTSDRNVPKENLNEIICLFYLYSE